MNLIARIRESAPVVAVAVCSWLIIISSSLTAIGLITAGCGRKVRLVQRPAAADGINRQEVIRSPNVLLITIDTLRADHLGCYGYREVKTPNIDRLAQTGVRFTQAYTPVPITLPSHATIMTGQYPLQTRVRDNGTFRLPNESTTLAEILKQHGYRTAAFVSAYVLDSRYGLDQGFDLYEDTLDQQPAAGRQISFLDSERRAEQVTRSALSWFDLNKFELNKSWPFFVWIHYFDPHASYHPPSPFAEQYAGHLYDGEIAYTDYWIGALLEHMEGLGLIDNTLVVLTADHGEGLGEHQEKTHAIFIYDTTLHIPLIMRHPRLIPPGRTISNLVRTLDIMPTILSLIGVQTQALSACSGVDLVSLIQGNAAKQQQLQLFCETLYPQLNHGWSPLEGIRTEGWKYIRAPKPELYNLAEDPSEVNNLWTKQPEEVIRQWANRLDELKKQLSSQTLGRGSVRLTLDFQARQRLQSLGYISWPHRSGESPLPDPKDMVAVQGEIDLAASWVNDGQYEQARQILAKIAGQNPDDLFVRFLLGQVYVSLKEWDLAREEFLAVIAKSQPDSAPASVGAGSSVGPDSDNDPDNMASAGYADAKVFLGIVYLEQGEYEKAIRELTETLKTDADQYQVFYNLGLAYSRLGQLDQALAWFDRALSLKPNQPDVQNNRGVILARQGKIREAIEAYSQAVRLDEKNPKPYQNLASLYQQQGDWPRAREIMDQALVHNPNSPDLDNFKAYLATQAGEYKEAGSILERALARDPHHAGLHTTCGLLYLKQQQEEGARLEFERAIECDPNFADAYYHLGLLFEQDWQSSKDPALARKAEECYQKLIQIAPSYHRQAHLQLASLLCRLGKPQQAISIYQKLLERGLNDLELRLNLGLAYGQSGRIDEAIAEYQKILKLDPKNAAAWFNLGVALMHKGNLGQAQEAYQQAIRLRPKYPEASLNLGIIYMRQGLADAAQKEWEKILGYDPQNAKAHCNLGNLALSQRDFTRAENEYRQALQTDPNSPETHFGLAAACINLGKEAEAVKEWQETVRLSPNNLEARINLAVAYINQKNLELARNMLSQVLQLEPGLAAAHQLLEKIRELEKGKAKK